MRSGSAVCSQYPIISALRLEDRGGRQDADQPYGNDQQQVAEKAQPDDTPRLAVAVDLSQYVPENVAQGKYYYCRR